jgi:hypothetical protein
MGGPAFGKGGATSIDAAKNPGSGDTGLLVWLDALRLGLFLLL